MSRSRKKVSCFSDYGRKYTRWSKRQASKRVRRYKGEIVNGTQYQKIYPSWDIRDYKFREWSFEDEWYEKGLRK